MSIESSAGNTVIRRIDHRHRWNSFARLALTALMLISMPGCNYFILLGYLIGGPPQIEPLFEKDTKKSLTDRNVRVAVVCYASDELKYECENIDHIIARQVTYQLSMNKIDVGSAIRTFITALRRSSKSPR